MIKLSKRLSQLQESQTVALNGLMAKMKKEGIDVVALGAGEPDFDTPAFIKEAAITAIQEGFTKYTPVEGTIELKDAICQWMKKEYGASYGPAEIVVTCGAKHAVYQAICAVCDPGDEVILPVPYWVSYPEQIQLAGAIMKTIVPEEKNRLKISAGQLQKAITTKTKLLILNSPSNPSGAVYNEAELTAIAKVLRESGIFVLADEIYDKIIFDNLSFTSMLKFTELHEQLLYVNGVSKSHAMTGWRIGFLAAAKEIISVVKNYQGHSTSNPTSISQKAALVAYLDTSDFQKIMNDAFSQRKDYVMQRLNAMKGVSCIPPQGAFYAFPDISSFYQTGRIKSSIDLCAYLLKDFKVAVVPGSAFGMDTHIRLSFATSMEMLQKALDRIEQGLMSLI